MIARLRVVLLVVFGGLCLPASAQFEERWIYGARGLTTDGQRSYITGVDAVGNLVRDPGFDPRLTQVDDSGAFLLLPVNAGGGSSRPFLQALLNLPWDVPRGFQVIRLDADGQVLWHRFLRTWPSDYTVSVPALAVPNSRLLPEGGLLVQTQGGLLFGPDGGAHVFPDAGFDVACLSETERSSAQYRGYSLAESGRVGRWYSLPGTPVSGRLCVIDLVTGVALRSTEPLGPSWSLLNHRLGVGAIFSSELSPGLSLLQMRRDGALVWEVESRSNAGIPRILADGSTWVAFVDGWRRVGAGGELLGQFLAATEFSPSLWHSDGRVVFSDGAGGRVRLVSPTGLTLWEQSAGVSLLGAAWHLVGPHAYAVPDAPQTGSAQVLRFELGSGQIDSTGTVSDSEVAWVPLPSGRSLSVRPGKPDYSLMANPSVCGASFVYCPVAQDLVSRHVFDFGPSVGTRTESFELPGEALPLAVASAVLPIAGSRDVVLVDRVFDGAKHVARATRISSEGAKVWERLLSQERFTAKDVIAGVGEGGVFIGTHGGWGAPQSEPSYVWKIDLQGEIQWRVQTALPLQQLIAMSNGASERMCGLSTRPDPPTQRFAWACLDSMHGGESAVLLDHPPNWRVSFEGVVDGRAQVRLFPGDPPTHDQFSIVEVDVAGAQSNLRSLAFEPSPLGRHRALVSYLAGSTSFGLANEHSDSDGYSQALQAVLAAFSSEGDRLWQRTLPGPFRYSQKGVTTGPEIRRAANGDVLVSLLLRGPLVDGGPRFPFALCRFSALGADRGCITAPFNGRPVDFVVPSDSADVLVWLLNYNASPRTELQLVPWTPTGLGAPIVAIPGFSINSHGAVRQRGDDAWAVASVDSEFAAGLTPDPDPSLVVVSAARVSLFADGFE